MGDRFKGVCDKNGCDIQAYRFNVRDFYGPSDKFKVNSLKPVTVTTQFMTDDGTDSGTINGNKHKTISDDMCKDWVAETKDGTNFIEKGGMGAVDTVFKNGAVLVMSLWDDHYANMLWLDSTYPVDQHKACQAGKGDPGTCRGSCDITSGVPADVEKDVANATIHFSDIKYGKIGTTVDLSNAITV